MHRSKFYGIKWIKLETVNIWVYRNDANQNCWIQWAQRIHSKCISCKWKDIQSIRGLKMLTDV